MLYMADGAFYFWVRIRLVEPTVRALRPTETLRSPRLCSARKCAWVKLLWWTERDNESAALSIYFIFLFYSPPRCYNQATFLPWGFIHPLSPQQQTYQHANNDGKRNSSFSNFLSRVQNLDQGGVVTGLDLCYFPSAVYPWAAHEVTPALLHYVAMLLGLTYAFSFTSLFLSLQVSTDCVSAVYPAVTTDTTTASAAQLSRRTCTLPPPLQFDSASQYWVSAFPPLSFPPPALGPLRN